MEAAGVGQIPMSFHHHQHPTTLCLSHNIERAMRSQRISCKLNPCRVSHWNVPAVGKQGLTRVSHTNVTAVQKQGLTYKDAGVDIDAGSELVRRIAAMAPGIGGFGGLFPLGDSYLVAGTDGVGTKLKLAFDLDVHDTIGIDLVAMSVNDIVTSGAKPLFFLDYFATSHLDVDKAEQVIKGIVEGCRQSDCALLGGETAEMPGFYANDEYDLSGFAVGIVKKDDLIDGSKIAVGDYLIGLSSTGVHSNGFSLVRRVLDRSKASLNETFEGAENDITLGMALLAPTKIYVNQVLEYINKGGVKGIAHVTGGGFTDNIPRVFPAGLGAAIQIGSWDVPPIFRWIQKMGGIKDEEMRRTFNMGIGMVLIVSSEAGEKLVSKGSKNVHLIGHVVEGQGVTLMDHHLRRQKTTSMLKRFKHPNLRSIVFKEYFMEYSFLDAVARKSLAP